MRPERIDLHTHSTVSDGTDNPTQLVRHAAAASLDVIALTDHDTFDGLDRAQKAGAEMGVRVVPGMEMSCEFKGKTIHLLAYGMDRHDAALTDELVKIRSGRNERLPRMLVKLEQVGMPMTTEEVMLQVGDAPSIGRPHLADAMVARGYVADRSEAFRDWLYDGGPAYVDRYHTELDQAIHLIRAAHGVAVIAHPWSRGSDEVLDEAALEHFVRIGLAGFEVDHEDHDADQRKQLAGIARSLGVLGTGSSDYHGTGKPNMPLGCNLTRPEAFEALESLMATA